MEFLTEVSRMIEISFFILGFIYTEILAVEPSFDVPVVNITAVEKTEAILPCSVEYLGGHKVVWTDQWSTLLTFDITRIIDDDRFSVERPRTEDWNLLIRNVNYGDRGQYICQINTEPVKTKYVVLTVLVPPKIDKHLSSKDVTVSEGSDVTLVCNVTGVPQPTVHWHRQPLGQSIGKPRQRLDNEGGHNLPCNYQFRSTGIGLNGEILVIKNISRYCNGLYDCFAFNNVPPAVSRGIQVFVKFPPEIHLTNKRIGQYKGKETILECTVSAYPQANTVWRRDGNDIVTNWKYRVDIYKEEGEYTLTLSLRVSVLNADDFGIYTCYAKNELGSDQEDMILYETKPLRTTTTTSTSTTTLETPRKEDIQEDREHGYYPGKDNKTLKEPVVLTKDTTSSLVVGNENESGQLVAERHRNSGTICTSSLILICQTKAAGISYLNNAQFNTAVSMCKILILCHILYNIIKSLS